MAQTVREVVDTLEQRRKLYGEDVWDKTHSRWVNEVLFPPVVTITSERFLDEDEIMGNEFTAALFASNWDMWNTSFHNLVVPQATLDRETRRAVLAFPHHCMVSMAFYARGSEASVYGFWRSLEHSKAPSDVVLFRRIAELFVLITGCKTGSGIIHVGSYHKEKA